MSTTVACAVRPLSCHRSCQKQQAPAAAATPAARSSSCQRVTPASRGQHVRTAATDFHQSLLVATERDDSEPLPPLPPLVVRDADTDGELQAASWLRAFSFYRYPEERKFAAEVRG